MKNFSTLPELISFQKDNFHNKAAFQFKEKGKVRLFSNQEFSQSIFSFACGLREFGMKKQDVFAIYSYQNPIWLIADFGAILAGAVTVPIFHNISKENLFFEIEDSDAKYIFCDNLDFFEEIKIQKPRLKIITYGFKKEGSASFEDLIKLGEKAIKEEKYNFNILQNEVNPQDVATIIYTSGSTGKPKGVELTHSNLISQVRATADFFPLSSEDVALSFLPLAHIFERMVTMFYISRGVSIYFVDNIKNLASLLKEVRPNLMTSVPRMLEKVFISIRNGVESGSIIKKFLGKKALKRALAKDPSSPQTFLDKFYDLLVFKKFRAALGGNIKMIICGGAALSKDLEIFYKNIGVNLFCGYGMTETSPVIAANCPKANKIGTVGMVYQDVEIKIADDGELIIRGPNVMRGYKNQPEKTAEIIKNGWLRTGDLARIDDGFLTITGRKKELFKNANGKYVSPIVIEQKIVQSLGFLLGAIVVAEGKKFTSAIIFPDFDILAKTKEKFSFQGSDQSFLESEILVNFVQKNLDQINQSLDHWEQVQKFHISLEPISIESGEITPSMKLKRSILEAKFKDVLDSFYAD